MDEYLNTITKQMGVTINGNNPHDVVINDKTVINDILRKKSLGLGEGYMDKKWDCKSLDELFYRIGLSQINVKFAIRPFLYLLSLLVNRQTRNLSKKVAEEHYNLGNDLYEGMLGKSMAYTCGYWKNAKNLDDAQYAKYELVCKKIGLKKGEKILDLGCGFGGFAKYAAEKYGAEVTAVNISERQVEFGREICKSLPVTFYLTDYRDDSIYNPNKKIIFDKIVSIGLCEHVGHKNYSSLMKVVSNNLKNHGIFLLHTIGRNSSSTHIDPWLNKYIFPNALLPSIEQLSQASQKIFVMEDWHNFGSDYDKTLMAWYTNFEKSWPKLKDRYGEKFYRMWKYYLLSCAGLFRSRQIQLWQIVYSKNGILGGYDSVR